MATFYVSPNECSTIKAQSSVQSHKPKSQPSEGRGGNVSSKPVKGALKGPVSKGKRGKMFVYVNKYRYLCIFTN